MRDRLTASVGFGELGVGIKVEEGEVTVELQRVDLCDPTTGQVRSSSIDDIACWLVETAYNERRQLLRALRLLHRSGRSLHHLKRPLQAELDEAA